MKTNIRKTILEYLYLALGSVIMAAGLYYFLIPAKIAPGGVSSIAMVTHHLLGWNVGIVMLALNIPLFLLGMKLLGKRFGPRTLFSFTLVSVFYDLMDRFIHVKPVAVEPLLAAIFGGIIIGFGLGIVFRAKGTTGGSDILGQIIHKYSNMSVGIAILCVDFFVILIAGSAFKDISLMLYGFISLYAASKVIDIVLDGFDYARSLYIISDKAHEIMQAVVEKNRGGTMIHGTGFYTRKERNVLFTVVTRKEVAGVREMVKRIDADAFVIISNVHEVLGEGFRPRV